MAQSKYFVDLPMKHGDLSIAMLIYQMDFIINLLFGLVFDRNSMGKHLNSPKFILAFLKVPVGNLFVIRSLTPCVRHQALTPQNQGNIEGQP